MSAGPPSIALLIATRPARSTPEEEELLLRLDDELRELLDELKLLLLL